jgi:hypothetical protein
MGMLRDVKGPNHCDWCGDPIETGRIRCLRCGTARLATSSGRVRRIEDLSPIPAPVPMLPPAPPPPPPGTRAYLTSPALQRPVLLAPDRATSIGRDQGNRLLLPTLQVSRRHAIVVWDGEGHVVIDRGSTNGTWVDGECVRRRRLAEGNKIGVGPFELMFRFGDPAPSPTPRPMHDTAILVQPGSFSGEIGSVTVPEVFQLLELSAKTGILSIRGDGERGEAVFSSGRVIHAIARSAGLAGEPAALTLIRIEKGNFRFTAMRKISSVRPTILRGTSSLLLEAARRSDEAARGQATDAAFSEAETTEA